MIQPISTVFLSLLLGLLLSCSGADFAAGDAPAAEDALRPNVCQNNDELVAKLRAELSETKKLLRNTHLQLRTFLKNESHFQVLPMSFMPI